MPDVSSPSIEVDAADPLGLPVVVGCPFKPGQLRDAASLRLLAPDGQPHACGARPLATWPDGGVRWALLSFAAVEKGTYRVATGGSEAPALASRVKIEESGGRFVLDNTQVRVELSGEGAGPITKLTALGRTVIDRAEQLRFEVDDASTLRETRRTIRLLESTPQRTRVRVEGAHLDTAGQKRLDYRLDVELWSSWPSLRLDYQFFNLHPGSESLRIRRMAMVYRPNVGAAPRRHTQQPHFGPFTQPRPILNPEPIAIRADHSRTRPYVEDMAMFRDDSKYVFYLQPIVNDALDWIGVVADSGGAYLRMDDFAAMKPKRLVSEGDTITLEIWPEQAGPLELPQGRSRRQTVTLAFTPGARSSSPPDAAQIRRLLTAPLHEGRATPSTAWCREAGEFDADRQIEPHANLRLDKYLGRLLDLDFPAGMFDLGDKTESGYTEGYAALGRQPLRPRVSEPNAWLQHSPHGAEWAGVDRFEPAWCNNEYDLIHALCLDLLRTGHPSIWPDLRRAVRHNVEVDFVHYSDDSWQHHGSPAHSANHNHSSAYPSHLWTQGLLEYHCLTGDPDALEVALHIGDTIIRNLRDPERGKFLWGFNREIGWPVLALVSLVDLTGEARFREALDEIVAYLMKFDRHGNRKAVNLSGVNPRHDMHRQIVSAFFGYASMIEGLDRYARMAGRDDLRAWLTRFLRDLRDAAERAHADGEPLDLRRMLPHGLAIGYELTGEVSFLELGMLSLEEFMDTKAWFDPPDESKAAAMIYRALTRFLKHAHEAGLLAELEYHFARRSKR